MSDTIKEVTDFSSDITLRSLVSSQGCWVVDAITVVSAGSGALALAGGFENTTLTGVADGDVVTLTDIKKILASGTSITKARIAFSRKSS